MAVLIIASLAPWVSAVAADTPQTQDQHSSSSTSYAEPSSSQLTEEQVEQAARANFEIIQPYMSRSDFVTLCQRLELDEGEHTCADEVFTRYNEQVQQIHQKFLDRVIPFAKHYYMAVQEGGEELARERAGEAVPAMGKIGERYQAQMRQRLAAFLVEVQTCLSESQSPAWPAAIRAWRRSVMLNPQGSDSGHNLGYHVDLFEVIDEACDEEPALRPLLDRQAEDPPDRTLAEARRQCLELLDAFELEFDRLIQRRFWRTWDLFFSSMQASRAGDEPYAPRARRQFRRGWITVYRANTTAAETLGSLIEAACGADIAWSWRDHYYAAYCPAMYRPKSTDLVYEWLILEAGLDLDQYGVVQEIYDRYLESRRMLRARTRAMLLRLAEDLNIRRPADIPGYTFTTGHAPEEKTRLEEQRRALSEHADMQFRNILTDEQRAPFDQALAKLRRRR